MDFIREHTTAVLGIIIAGAVIAGYVLFFGGSNTSTSALQVTKPSAATTGVSRELLSTLLQLHAVNLDPAIWQDATFRSLRDFGVQLAPQPVGRENPFLPLGVRARGETQTATGGGSSSAASQGAKPTR